MNVVKKHDIIFVCVIAILSIIIVGAGIIAYNYCNSISGELGKYKELYRKAGEAESNAEQRNGELEAQLAKARKTVGDTTGTANSISDNASRLDNSIKNSGTELAGLREVLRRVDEENNKP